jgi:hypothetical protein
MLASSFKDTLLLMSNRELREFLQDVSIHSPEEQDAAREEAKKRGIETTAPSVLTEPQLVLAKVDLDPDDHWGSTQQVEDVSAPLLYSKRAIYTFTFLFSVLFGAFLMVLNLRALRKPEGVVPTVSFSIGYLTTVIVVLNFLESHFKTTLSSSYLVAWAGAVLILQLIWNKYIGKEIKYRKRDILVPTIVGIAFIVGFILIIWIATA